MLKKLILVFLLLPVFLFAQSSGKIAGVVVDKSTGDPLPGVNVILEGTTLGSSTDIDGYFVVLNVPVGLFTIRANYIGYKDVVMQDVRVSANITTEVNYEMTPTTLELDEAIVITAERPLVEKNVTSSISLVTAEEIESVPVRGLTSLIALQTSVIVQDGNIHIRGSREDEVGYYLDGANINNVENNTRALVVIQEAIEEFQVFAGGYTADMGGANGGIVRSEIKTGGSDYHVTADFQTDKFANTGDKFLNTYSYQYHNAVVTLSGPLMSNKVRFFLAGQNTFQGDRQQRWSEGFDFADLMDDGQFSGRADTVDMHYPDGFTPHNKQNQYAVNGTLLFDFSPIKFRVGGAFTHTKRDLDDTPMLNVLNNRDQYDVANGMLLTAKMTHILNPKTYYELNFSFYNRKIERKDEFFGNEWTKWYDSLAHYEAGYSTDIFTNRYNTLDDHKFYGIDFLRDGEPGRFSQFYTKNEQNYLGAGLDFVSQMGRHHELKFGFDARYYTVRNFAIATQLAMASAGENGGLDVVKADDELSTAFATAGRVDNYGYNWFGEKTDDGIDAPKHPTFGSIYFQDKIEYNDLIINAGLRLDYFDTDDRALVDYQNPDFNLQTKQVEEAAFEDKDAVVQLSPRLGFSFPVSEKTVFYLQYGKFIQMSELDNVYYGSAEYSRQMVGGFFYTTPIGFGLDPTKTTSYEVGFRQQLSEVAAIDISGFYKNVKGQVQVTKQRVAAASVVTAYMRLQNGDFATSKGLEMRLSLRRTNRIQAQLNYTYTDAQGTGSAETGNVGSIYNNDEQQKTLAPLDFSQKHTGSVVLDYRFGRNDGGPILSQLGINSIFTFSSGHPYTYSTLTSLGQVDPYDAGVDYMNDTRTRKANEGLNASTTPWNFNLDLRIDKTFRAMDMLDITLYASILNVLNTKNVINVYQTTGSADDDGFISNSELSESFILSAGNNTEEGGKRYLELYDAINTVNGQAYWDYIGQQLYGTPRQIWFGIKLAY